ncbi:3-oxoadipate enol-lactonase [Klebsiella quasipneumoniae]|nr:3-oxoadipate enol-lactonase [Klebsiella quasipneumoniae]SSG61513.1 3-oxoadipate enol-lactonase [Klebsiella quasipneumoniae]
MSLLTPMLRSSPLTDWFSDAQRVQGMLDFEAALAQAQAACGMVPTAAVGPIVAACRHEAIDFTALGEAAVGAGNLAIPLVKQLTAQVKARDPDAARYVHWGATSQDAIDTGLVLQLRGALDAAERLLERLLAALAGQALDYQLDGPEGAPVIVLSNSLGTTRAMWQPQIEALTAHFRVLRYDTHGHDKTTKNGKVTLAQLGEDVIALLDHLNIDRAWFCGISMGGLTGLWLGRFAPERFYGLAVANTAARIGDQASWLSRARAVRQEGMAVVAAGAADRWFTHAFRQKAPEVVEALCHQLTHTDAEGYAACCEALAAADLRGEVGQIPLPTLIIAGESDPVTTVADANFLQQQIPASQVVVLPASHLSNIEAAKSFTSALLSFFQGERHGG